MHSGVNVMMQSVLGGEYSENGARIATYGVPKSRYGERKTRIVVRIAGERVLIVHIPLWSGYSGGSFHKSARGSLVCVKRKDELHIAWDGYRVVWIVVCIQGESL